MKRLLSFHHKWFPRIIRGIWNAVVAIVLFSPLYVYLVIKNPFDLFGGMPSLRQIENPENDLSSEVISADGVTLGRYFRYNRSAVTYEQISPILVRTLLISEDHRFYDHAGMDFWSYLRVLKGIVTLNLQGGGSTITQQTAKNLFHTRSDELQGKLAKLGKPFELVISKTKEWIIGVYLEKNFTKEEIIALYFNTVPFNNEAFGIKVAAETYFSKPLKQINIQEAALLVGMLQGTYLFNPTQFPERALRKRNDVLWKLFKHNVITTRETYDSLAALPLQLKFKSQNPSQGLATYFRSVLRNQMVQWCKEHGYDLFDSGLKIYTTIDSRLQRHAEEVMTIHMRSLQHSFDQQWSGRYPWSDADGNEMPDYIEQKAKQTQYYQYLVHLFGERSDSVKLMLHAKRRMRIFTWKGERDTVLSAMDSIKHYSKLLHTGIVSINPLSGEVKAWVGGIQHKHFKFDHVLQSKRQPGSTFKAFVYGKAIEDGYSPCQEFYDVSPAININGSIYQVTNSNGTLGDGKPYTLRQALAKSLNSVTMQLVERIKPKHIIDFAHRAGIKSDLDEVYSIGLGTSVVSLLEITGAYCTFVNQGLYTQPYFITHIEDKHGNVLDSFVPERMQALDENTAYKIIYLLKGSVEEEGGSSRALSQWVTTENEVAGKTGTTNNASDGWYIGMTPSLVTGVWIGGQDPVIRFPNWTSGSGARTALPLWDAFMQGVYHHPEWQIPKGYFRQPQALDALLECDVNVAF